MMAQQVKASGMRTRGVALVEFALVLPLLLVVSLLVTELGRALYQYNTLTKAVRDAARYLSVHDPSIKTTNPALVLVARNLAVFGTPQPSTVTQPLALGLSLANVPDANITWATRGANPLINTVTIQITGYSFRPILSSVFGIPFGDAQGLIPFGPISATMRAQL